MQQQHLRPGGKRVVPDQQKGRGRRGGCHGGHRARRRVQIGGAVMDIGLQIGGLGPFVPGVNADQRLAGHLAGLRVRHQPSQPSLVLCRGRTLQHQASPLAAGVVIPAGQCGLDQRKIRRGLGQRSRHHVVVRKDLRGGARVEIGQLGVAHGQAGDQFVRRELDGRVEAAGAWVHLGKALRHHQQWVLAVALAEQGAPACHAGRGVGDQGGAIDHQQRSAPHLRTRRLGSRQADVAGVAKMPGEAIHQRHVVLGPVILADQHVVIRAVPPPCPILVGPHQAKRKIHARLGEHRLGRRLQQAAAVEPVEIMHEAEQPGIARHRHLAAHRCGAVQRVVAQVARHPRLVVALEARHGAGDRSPFGEAGAPPFVIFRYRMELRQVVSEHLGPPAGAARQLLDRLEIRPRAGVATHRLEHPGFVLWRRRVHAQQAPDTAEVQQRILG